MQGPSTDIMAILNITPDSFSGDGVLASSSAFAKARRVCDEAVSGGAKYLDIGAASSRPGAQSVPVEEELRRLRIGMEAARDCPLTISVDTTDARVAKVALADGARMINSVLGARSAEGTWNDKLLRVVADAGAAFVITHNPGGSAVQGMIGGHYQDAHWLGTAEDVRSDLARQCEHAIAIGVDPKQMFIDCGIGFGKGPVANVALLRDHGTLTSLGYPLLLGVSRKSVLGHVLGALDSPTNRDVATAVVSSMASRMGAAIVRVHDVAASAAAIIVNRELAPTILESSW